MKTNHREKMMSNYDIDEILRRVKRIEDSVVRLKYDIERILRKLK